MDVINEPLTSPQQVAMQGALELLMGNHREPSPEWEKQAATVIYELGAALVGYPLADRPTRSNHVRNLQALESHLQITQVVDLASLLATEAFDRRHLDQPLDSFIDAVLDLEYQQHPSLAPLAAVFGTPGGDPDEWDNRQEYDQETLRENSVRAERKGFLGFGVQLSSPVRTYFSPNSYSLSWGYCNTMWCYAESIDEAWQLGVAWVEQKNQKALAKAGFSAEVGE